MCIIQIYKHYSIQYSRRWFRRETADRPSQARQSYRLIVAESTNTPHRPFPIPDQSLSLDAYTSDGRPSGLYTPPTGIASPTAYRPVLLEPLLILLHNIPPPPHPLFLPLTPLFTPFSPPIFLFYLLPFSLGSLFFGFLGVCFGC